MIEENRGINPMILELVDRQIKERGIANDSITPFLSLHSIATGLLEWERLTRLPTYREYFLSKGQLGERILQTSSSEAVGKYDALVEKFNRELEEIKVQRDSARLMEIYKVANLLIRGK